MKLNLFGFSIERAGTVPDSPQEQPKSFAPPVNDDGALVIQMGAHYGTYVDIEGTVKNEHELITRYNEMSMQPECESAIDDITNEAIVHDEEGRCVSLVLDQVDSIEENIKEKIREEFDNVLRLLNFSNQGHDIFRRWYIAGRLYYHVIIDEENPEDGIKELRFIDPRRIRKVRQIQKTPDTETKIEVVNTIQEYYIYNDKGPLGGTMDFGGVKIAKDSIVNINSGLMDSRKSLVLSYLHKAIKPLNNLRMMEDAIVIYRISRMSERRLFYIDVGNLPTKEAEKYLNMVMTKYRNKLVYDSQTGEIKDDRKYMSLQEDIWIPRREGNSSTEIDTLPGGEHLDQIADIEYFQQRLYQSLGVPVTRLNPGEPFSIGFSNEISRDELKFAKFINRLRNRFSHLFDDLMRIQLVTKKICTEEEWIEIREKLHYDFLEDNNFSELKEQQLLNLRLATLGAIEPYVGIYFSQGWVKRHVLRMDDDEIELMEEEIDEEGPVQGAGTGAIDPTTGMPIEPASMMGGGVMPQPGQNPTQGMFPTRPSRRSGEEPKRAQRR